MSTSKLHYDALRQHERWTSAHDLKLKKMIKDGKKRKLLDGYFLLFFF